MNRIEIDCPRCSAVLQVPTLAVLVHHAHDESRGWLVCPECHELVGAALPPAAVPALVRAGCPVLDAPDRVPHPEQRPDGPPLDADDALALHALLGDDSALARALGDLAGT